MEKVKEKLDELYGMAVKANDVSMALAILDRLVAIEKLASVVMVRDLQQQLDNQTRHAQAGGGV